MPTDTWTWCAVRCSKRLRRTCAGSMCSARPAPSTRRRPAGCWPPGAQGLGLRVHGNQLSAGPGVRIAVDTGAASVDHCTYLTDRDIAALASSSTVATLLPACDLSTRQPPAPARALIDAGARIALASNCNPGSSYTSSMNLVVALGVLLCQLSTQEAVYAAPRVAPRRCSG